MDGDLAPNSGVEDLYLELLKTVLLREGLGGQARPIRPRRGVRHLLYSPIAEALRRRGLELVRVVDDEIVAEGRGWKSDAETMIGRRRLNNLQECITDVLEREVPGDLIETGVWRGGASIFMRAVLKARRDTERLVWAADSFQGLPPPDPGRFPEDAQDEHWRVSQLAVPLDQVKANFARYGLLDDQVRFLPGWFRDTLPTAPVECLSVLRLDGDMYESTMVALECLYDKLSVGGYAIVDDYGAVPGCRSAVDEFRDRYGLTEKLVRIDWTGVYWRRAR